MTQLLSQAHGLSIGVAGYQCYQPLLNTVHDASDISAALVDPHLCAYPTDQVTLLSDAKATRANIIAALDQLASRTNADSIVFVFYAGHGKRVESGPLRGEYLLPVDAQRADNADAFRNSVISGEEFGAKLKSIKAQKLVVVLDCCHAEGVGLLRDSEGHTIREGLSDDYLSGLAAGSGRVVLAASGSLETASDGSGRNGLFTGHLLAGLRGGAGGHDEFIHIFDLYNYIQPRVVKDRPTQIPVFKAELREDFVVAMRLGGRSDGLFPPAHRTGRSPQSYTRPEVYRLMCSLLPSQFEEILFLLDIPVYLLPSHTASQSIRATAVIALVELPNGIGLHRLVEALPFR